MPVLFHRRRLLPALFATAILSGPGALTTSAHAAGTQAIDATVEYQCAAKFEDIATSTQRASLRLKATVSATTSPGERLHLTRASATLRLLAPGVASSTTLTGVSDLLEVEATGVDQFPNSYSGFLLNEGANASISTTPYVDGGFGPFIFPLQSSEPSPRRTTGADPVVLTAGLLDFDYQLLPALAAGEVVAIPLPRESRFCQPIPGQEPLAVIPSVTTEPAPPAITSVSPASGRLRGGNTITIKGSGFSTPGTPIVKLGSGISLASNVKVIDDTTMTITVPMSYRAGKTQVTVELADRTIAPDPKVYYEYVGELTEPMVTAVTPAAGRAGDVITIEGTDVDLITSIEFGFLPRAEAAAITVESESRIKVKVPARDAEPGPVRMTLTGLVGGVFAPGLETFTYLPPLAMPTMKSLTPATAKADLGNIHLMGGANFANVAYVQVGKTRIKPLLVINGGRAMIFVSPPQPAGTYPVTLVARDGRFTPADPARTITYR